MAIDFALPRKQKQPPAKAPEVTNTNVVDLGKARNILHDYDEVIAELERQEAAIQVTDDKTNQELISLGSRANQALKKIEAKEKEILAPVKLFQSIIKKYKDQLKAVVQRSKAKNAQYQNWVELERRKQQEAIRKANDDLQKKLDQEAKRSGIEPPKVGPMELPKEDRVVRTDDGSSSHLRRPWKGRIVDEQMLAHLLEELRIKIKAGDLKKTMEVYEQVYTVARYHTWNQQTINQAIRAGIREIPGVDIRQEIETVYR